jgi:capsular exopolysaccharide synthesis family protein
MTNNYNSRRRSRLSAGPDAGAPFGNGEGLLLPGASERPDSAGMPQFGRLIRKYIWLTLGLMLLGAVGGVAAVVFSSPIYKARTMLEVQGINEAWLRNSFESAASFDSNQVNIETQITLLKSGPFLQRVYDRLQAETVPPPPQQADFFSRIRRRVHSDTQDPIEIMKVGLQTAFESFDARPINQTRLIELSCDSTNPQMASQFINTMASEFIDESSRSRSQTSQKTSEWLSSQIEENKIKLQEAERRMQEFVVHSGNMFASHDGTLDDSKLKGLQAELATIQADRIAKQARYEMASKSPAANLPEILDDDVLRGYQTQLSDLQRQKAELDTTLMPKNPKVVNVTAQIDVVQANLNTELEALKGRIKNEYDTALNREKLLSAAYASQLQRVSGTAGKSADYNALQREVDTLRQLYQNLLAQANQSGMSSSVPVDPIRLVEATVPPSEPYKPRPILNIGFGLIAGLFLSGGIGFLREKADRSVQHPRTSQHLFNVPQLGVIPSARALEGASLMRRIRRTGPHRRLNGEAADRERDETLSAWSEGPSYMAESFRTTLTSLLREPSRGGMPRIILVTSPGPAEGKTTIAANVGMGLAETGRKVLLVDADFRRPRLHQIFGLPNVRGFGDLIARDAPPTAEELAGVMIPTTVPRLTVLVNRPIGGNISKVLYSPFLKNAIEQVSAGFDIVLIDTPPLLHLADARLIAPFADGVILVIRAGVTDRESALEACECIQEDGLNLMGTVLNDWNPGSSHVKRHYYYDYSTRK